MEPAVLQVGGRSEPQMRTSGAPEESALTYVPIIVALILVVVLLGGPSDVLRTLELALSRFVLTVRDYIASWL